MVSYKSRWEVLLDRSILWIKVTKMQLEILKLWSNFFLWRTFQREYNSVCLDVWNIQGPSRSCSLTTCQRHPTKVSSLCSLSVVPSLFSRWSSDSWIRIFLALVGPCLSHPPNCLPLPCLSVSPHPLLLFSGSLPPTPLPSPSQTDMHS